MNKQTASFDYDVLIIGSGFGGSVSALRLVEKGYRVLVVEAGRRFADAEFARTSWNLRKFLWAPKLGCHGIQRIHPLPNVWVLAGAGVGGGSLVYANTLYEPQSNAFYEDPQWAHITDWRTELAPYYDQAARMLGVVINPTTTLADRVYREVAESMGVGHTFRFTPVGVYFGRNNQKEPGIEADDPYFGGAGPKRKGCIECGECMVGCRHNAKNTLVKNYLYLAEKAGVQILANKTVRSVIPQAKGYKVQMIESGSWFESGSKQTITAEHVIFAGGTWGTQKLLHRMKFKGILPKLSPKLGMLTRTNSEAICAATTNIRNKEHYDFTHGVAITSSFHPNANTHIECVRYGKHQDAMGMLATLMTDGGGRIPRWAKWIKEIVTQPFKVLAHYIGINSWSERTTIALVMQNLNNSITVFPKRSLFGGIKLSSKQGHGQPNPNWIPAANQAVRQMARLIRGSGFSSMTEIFDIPLTAHFLGGCTMGSSIEEGVIDPYHRVYNYPGLHIIDGSTISANIGVNPSLTITAKAERAIAMWPNKGEIEKRPPLGQAYKTIEPVPPKTPQVPTHAPAALNFKVILRSDANHP